MKSLLLSLFVISGMFAAHANAELLSTYTSISDPGCVIYDAASLHKDPEIDFLTEECAGLGGYRVMISGGDLRYPLHLVYNGKEITLTNVGAFHQLGANQIEWLYERTKNPVQGQSQVTYKALIHRINYADVAADKDLTMLVVTKLAQENTCPVAIVKAAADMNQKARAIAEKADSMSCLDLNLTP